MTPEAIENLWMMLVQEGNFRLIELLAKAKARVPGYSVIIVPKRKGFSSVDYIHNQVIRYMKDEGIEFVNVAREKGCLENALRKGLKEVKKMNLAYPYDFKR